MISIKRSKVVLSTFLCILTLYLSACGGGSSDDQAGVDPVVLNFVLALFPVNGVDWNDYLAGSDSATATDTACDAPDPAKPPCIHGGEHRVVEATGKSSCAGLTASDELGAFNWVCDDSSGVARMISTEIAEGKFLSDLIDFTTAGFRTNRVTVFDNGAIWGQTPASTWWNNTIELVAASSPTLIGDASTIYLLNESATGTFFIDADKISLVIKPAATLTGPAAGASSYIVQASGRNHIWLEGSIDATGDEMGVRLVNVSYSNLRNITSNNASFGNGIYLESSHNNDLSLVNATANIFGIWLNTNSTGNNLVDLNLENNFSNGLYLSEGSSNNTFANVMASDSDNSGVFLDNVINNIFNNVTSNNHITGSGIRLVGSSNNVFENVTVNDSQCGGSCSGIDLLIDFNFPDDVYSDGNSFTAVTAIGNDSGIRLLDSSDNTFSRLNVTGNIIANCSVETPSGTEGGRVPGDPGLDNNCLASIADNPTNPGTVFSLYPTAYLTEGYQESYDFSGTSTSVGNLTGSLVKQTQAQSTFLGDAAVPIIEDLDLIFSNGSSSLQRTDYYSPDLDSLSYSGFESTSTTSTSGSFIFGIPLTGSIGDTGDIGNYFDTAGNITVASWRIGDAGDGRANLIFSKTIYSDPDTITSAETDSYLIDPNGDRVSLNRIAYNPLFGGVTINFLGDNLDYVPTP